MILISRMSFLSTHPCYVMLCHLAEEFKILSLNLLPCVLRKMSAPLFKAASFPGMIQTAR